MNKICLNQQCKKIFYKQPSDSKKYWTIKKYCSIACSGTTFKKGRVITEAEKNNLRKLNSGEKNHFWKGGKPYMTAQGYVCIWVGPNVRQLEHRYVMEQYLGRKLLRNEHVHHMNGDKTDNRLKNLCLVNPKNHGKAHAMQRWHGSSVRVV